MKETLNLSIFHIFVFGTEDSDDEIVLTAKNLQSICFIN